MKYIILVVLILLTIIQASNLRNEGVDFATHTSGPCLPNTDLSGNQKDESHAARARKQLTRFADDMSEELRKSEGRQPYPNMYPESDNNCVGPGQDPSKRDRRMRRG